MALLWSGPRSKHHDDESDRIAPPPASVSPHPLPKIHPDPLAVKIPRASQPPVTPGSTVGNEQLAQFGLDPKLWFFGPNESPSIPAAAAPSNGDDWTTQLGVSPATTTRVRTGTTPSWARSAGRAAAEETRREVGTDYASLAQRQLDHDARKTRLGITRPGAGKSATTPEESSESGVSLEHARGRRPAPLALFQQKNAGEWDKEVLDTPSANSSASPVRSFGYSRTSSHRLSAAPSSEFSGAIRSATTPSTLHSNFGALGVAVQERPESSEPSVLSPAPVARRSRSAAPASSAERGKSSSSPMYDSDSYQKAYAVAEAFVMSLGGVQSASSPAIASERPRRPFARRRAHSSGPAVRSSAAREVDQPVASLPIVAAEPTVVPGVHKSSKPPVPKRQSSLPLSSQDFASHNMDLSDSDDDSDTASSCWFDAVDAGEDMGLAGADLKKADDGLKKDKPVRVKRASQAALVFALAGVGARGPTTGRRTILQRGSFQRVSRLLTPSPPLSPTRTVSFVEMFPNELGPARNQDADSDAGHERRYSTASEARGIDYRRMSSDRRSEFSLIIPPPSPSEHVPSRLLFRPSADRNFLQLPPRQLKKQWKRGQKAAARADREREREKEEDEQERVPRPSAPGPDPFADPSESSERLDLTVEIQPASAPSSELPSPVSADNRENVRHSYILEGEVGPNLRRFSSSLASSVSGKSWVWVPRPLKLVPPNAWLFLFGFLLPPLWWAGAFFPITSKNGKKEYWGSARHSPLLEREDRESRLTSAGDAEKGVRAYREALRFPVGPDGSWPDSSRTPHFGAQGDEVPGSRLLSRWLAETERKDSEASYTFWAHQRAIHTWRLRCRVMSVLSIFMLAAIVAIAIVAGTKPSSAN